MGKDYLFFGAIAGVRNTTSIPPLIPPRGVPSHLSWQVQSEIAHGNFEPVGWLTLAEINAALAHQGIERERLTDEVLNLLDIMGVLENRYGVDRVRLLFEFD